MSDLVLYDILAQRYTAVLDHRNKFTSDVRPIITTDEIALVNRLDEFLDSLDKQLTAIENKQ